MLAHYLYFSFNVTALIIRAVHLHFQNISSYSCNFKEFYNGGKWLQKPNLVFSLIIVHKTYPNFSNAWQH